MKNKPKYTETQFKLLQKRKIIETVFSLIQEKYHLKDFKFCSITSLFIVIITSLLAYTISTNKPKLNIDLTT